MSNSAYGQLNEHKHRRNGGYSMIELLVTLAIMAVLIGGSLLSYSLVTRTNVKKAASASYDVLANTRVNAKAKATYYWAVKIDYSTDTPNVQVYKGSTSDPSDVPYETQKLPKNVDLTIKYYDASGTVTTQQIGEGDAYDANAVRIYYSQLTGSVSKITCEKNGIASAVTIASSSDGYCDLIFSHSKTYTVRIYLSTGKQEIIQ